MKIFLVIAAVTAFTSGCATVLNDSTDTITVNTTRQDSFTAQVGSQQLTVPGTITVPRDGSDYEVTTTEDGCTSSTSIPKSMDTAFIGNVIIGGTLGSSTDYATGAMWDYDSQVTVVCQN